jgi:putative CocE/NonD family hydrolase
MSITLSQPEFDVVVEKNVKVPMRDDIRLATDIYRPAVDGNPAQGTFPTILVRTPYNKERHTVSGGFPVEGTFFARRGYVYAVQDCRGRYQSEGAFYILKDEGSDGYDTVEWIAQQPWSNGHVGTMGTSYMSWVQSSMAVLHPPHLTAMMPDQGAWNAYMSSFRQNGCFEMRFMGWAFFGAASSVEAHTDLNVSSVLRNTDLRDWLQRIPLKKGHSPLALAPAYERWFFDIFTTGEYNAYWQQRGFAFQEYVDDHADVPVSCTGGWYDSYTRSTSEMFMDLSRTKTGPITLLMGPWTHGSVTKEVSFAGDVDFGPDAIIDWFMIRLRFFDQYLKGLDTGLTREPPVRLFVMGGGSGKRTPEGRLDHGGQWRWETKWPLARTSYTPYYLHDDMSLSPSPPNQETPSGTTFIYDPCHPVPTIGGNISALMYLTKSNRPLDVMMRLTPVVQAGAYNQVETPTIFGSAAPFLPLASRHDVLVFQTSPLPKAVEVTGPMSVTFWIASSAPDTDFTAKLIDVYPPNEDYPEGYAMNISDSIMRARFHRSWEQEAFLEKNTIYQLHFKLYPTSNLFAVNHRIRLDVSSSNYPRFDLNSNTGESIGRNTYRLPAKNTIYHDAQHPSHIRLPIIPLIRR